LQKPKSIQNAFEHLCKKELLEEMKPLKEKNNLQTWRQISLEKLPVILILHLKWFTYKKDCNGYTKLIKNFEFPKELKIYSSKYIFVFKYT